MSPVLDAIDLENLADAVWNHTTGQAVYNGVAAALTAVDVWEYASRTLTMTATEVTSAVSGDNMSAVRGNTWTLVITDITLDDNAIQFVMKTGPGVPDSSAILSIDKTGLLLVNGAEGTLADASLSYVGTTLTITVEASVTALLPAGSYDYGIQSIAADGTVSEPYMGTFTIIADIARAIS